MLVTFFAAESVIPIAAADWRVGTVANTRRVLREETGVFDAKPAVAISAARNEWESFQVLIRSTAPVRGATIVPDDLVGPDGSLLPASAARIYRQHQLEINKPSPRNKDFKSGWYPDALIPSRHPVTSAPLTGARFSAAPFDLPSNQTHGFLIDLHIPADARPGSYHGVYRIKGEGTDGVEIPITLTVWDFVLPATPTLQTAFGSPAERMRAYYRRRASKGLDQGPANYWDALEEQCAQLLSEHHINATPARLPRPDALPDGSFQIPPEQVTALREFIDRYHLNAIQLPHPNNVVKDPQQERRLRAWLAAWDRAIEATGRPSVVFYFYLRDEPNDQAAY
ncbi:MAG TPA: hypothetical protein VJY15_01490, partial [Candidatus Acidoferrum sp.]|nr:hypothetical protein [Candidatus Acidoferrum sp.]